MKVFLTGGSGFIGTNLIRSLCARGDDVRNFDLNPPLERSDSAFWERGDIEDLDALTRSMERFAPDWVIHLAARTDCDESTSVEGGYRANTLGSQNVLEAVRHCDSVRRLVVTSSQFVCGPGRLPDGDEDCFPATVYGQSKVVTEQLTRSANLECIWTIVRPTNVWGPHHQRYAREFWNVLDRGWYLHPGVESPVRSYAYVGNVVWQLLQILETKPSRVHGKTLYLGDRPIALVDWVRGFHHAITRRQEMRVIPLWLLGLMARLGDAVSRVTRRPFYINSSRLRSMTTNYPTPMEATLELLGEPPYGLEEGIRETVDWFRRTKRT